LRETQRRKDTQAHNSRRLIKKVLHTNINGSFRNCSLKGSLGNQKWFFRK